MSDNKSLLVNDLIDSSVTDPPCFDPDFPYEQFVTHFESQGSVVHATVWISEGPAPKGTFILSPQMFGGDRLESLIIPMMAAGINVMTFHPRGMWDNQHIYCLPVALDDALAAAAFIRSTADAGVTTPGGRPWRTDPKRIAVGGLSGGGGNVGITACAEDPDIQAAVAVAPNSMQQAADPEMLRQSRAFFEVVKAHSAGRIDMEKTLSAMTAAEHERLSPLKHAHRLVGKNLLLVGASRDTVSPLETNHRVIADAMREHGVVGFDEVILDSDHAFLTKRIALTRIVIAWLKERCGF